MQLVWGKVEFNACRVSLLWHNSFLVSLWTFQPTLIHPWGQIIDCTLENGWRNTPCIIGEVAVIINPIPLNVATKCNSSLFSLKCSRCSHDELQTLFIVEAWFKYFKLWWLCCMMMLRWINSLNSREYKRFEIYAVTIKISLTVTIRLMV